MRRILLVASLGLAGCSSGLTGNPAVDVPAVLQTIQPVESAVACAIQAQANAAAPIGMALGKPDVTAGAMVASAIAGTFCNGLHAGAALPTPVAVAGTTALPGPSGTVVLPVPVLPKP